MEYFRACLHRSQSLIPLRRRAVSVTRAFAWISGRQAAALSFLISKLPVCRGFESELKHKGNGEKLPAKADIIWQGRQNHLNRLP